MLCSVYGMYRKTRHFMVANQIHVPRTKIRNRFLLQVKWNHWMHFLQAINSDLSVLIVYNKTGGTIKGDIKKKVK